MFLLFLVVVIAAPPEFYRLPATFPAINSPLTSTFPQFWPHLGPTMRIPQVDAMASSAKYSAITNNMDNIRGLFSVGGKNSVPRDLQKALSILNLKGLNDLEERILSLDAFLKPWAVFRDSIFLLQPKAIRQATTISRSAEEQGISRTDILWFYTQFDEGVLRYDPRADVHNPAFDQDKSLHGVINKAHWGVGEHEKHLYAWLLQELKVGKGYNPWRFTFLELRSVCVVWEAVLVPIVNALRASYDPKGRQFYGRLALYVEERSPSSLAFPNSNIGVAEGSIMSPTPYRIISVPKKIINNEGATFFSHENRNRAVLGKKHYDETERELRHVYPHFGGLIERPRYKHSMDVWLAEQQERADRRKTVKIDENVQAYEPQVQQRGKDGSPIKKFLAPLTMENSNGSSAGEGSRSPFVRYANAVRRSLSRNSPSKDSNFDHKSPLHGVTRQLYFSDHASVSREDAFEEDMGSMASTRPEHVYFTSQRSRHTSVRDSTVPSEVGLSGVESEAFGLNTNDSDPTINDELAATTRRSSSVYQEDLSEDFGDAPCRLNEPVDQKQSSSSTRVPSYEGTDYHDEISLTDLHANRMVSARTPQPPIPVQAPSRLPVPVAPVRHGGHRQYISPGSTRVPQNNDLIPLPESPRYAELVSYRDEIIAGEDPVPKAIPWPGFESDHEAVTPPIPAKSPKRKTYHSHHTLSPPRRLLEDAEDVRRIVSRENIRAALGDASRDSFVDDMVFSKPFGGPVRTLSPNGPLQTYNTHLFPRQEEGKDKSGSKEEDVNKFEFGGAYERDEDTDQKVFI